MDIIQDPFNILNASILDGREKLERLAERCSMSADPCECMDALSELVDPERRLAAEMAWLPGVEPERAVRLLSLLERKPAAMLLADNLPPLARANILASAVADAAEVDPGSASQWIIKLADCYERLDASEIRTVINAARARAGFPPATLESVARELEVRKMMIAEELRRSMDELDYEDLASAAAAVADNYEGEAMPALAKDLLSFYRSEVSEFLIEDERKLTDLAAMLRSSANNLDPDLVLAPIVEDLVAAVEDWELATRPIAALSRANGRRHEPTSRVASLIRDLAIDLYNKYSKAELARTITNALWDLFNEASADEMRAAPRSTRRREDDRPKGDKRYISRIYRLTENSFKHRGSVYSVDDIEHIDIRITTNADDKFFLAPKRERVEMCVTLRGGDDLMMARSGITIVFHKFGGRGMRKLVEFYGDLSRITFDARLAMYDEQERIEGYFESDGCKFYRDRIVFGEYTFRAGKTTFTRDGSIVAMKSSEHRLVERFRFLAEPPRFTLHKDADVILFILKRDFGAELSWDLSST